MRLRARARVKTREFIRRDATRGTRGRKMKEEVTWRKEAVPVGAVQHDGRRK